MPRFKKLKRLFTRGSPLPPPPSEAAVQQVNHSDWAAAISEGNPVTLQIDRRVKASVRAPPTEVEHGVAFASASHHPAPPPPPTDVEHVVAFASPSHHPAPPPTTTDVEHGVAFASASHHPAPPPPTTDVEHGVAFASASHQPAPPPTTTEVETGVPVCSPSRLPSHPESGALARALTCTPCH